MNCQTFSELASDIARDQMMDATARAQALAHAGGCVNCASRLREQQQLTADLRELALASKDQTASAMVWESLSDAFDAKTIPQITPNRRKWIYAAGAIAAMLILTFGVMQLVPDDRSTNMYVTIAATFTPAPAASIIDERRNKDVIVRAIQNRPITPRRHSATRRTLTPQVNQPKEVATDFILLTYDASDVGSEAQMVRVELPRSAMANFGLPVNMDRADQRVKADVLLGADGLARAIRFVQ